VVDRLAGLPGIRTGAGTLEGYTGLGEAYAIAGGAVRRGRKSLLVVCVHQARKLGLKEAAGCELREPPNQAKDSFRWHVTSLSARD
jgi:hypothetical protein